MKALKKVPSDKKGLSKLPTEVRNKMGYMKKGGKVKGMTTAQRKEEYVEEKGKKAYKKSYDKTYKPFKKQYLPYKLTSELSELATFRASNAKKSAEDKASKKFDKNTKYDDLLGRSTNPDKKYKKGGKVFKPHMMYKGGKAVMAKTLKDHGRLEKQGYSHKKG